VDHAEPTLSDSNASGRSRAWTHSARDANLLQVIDETMIANSGLLRRAQTWLRALNLRGDTMLQRLHHVAYRCLDAAQTLDFYTNVVGPKFAHAIAQDRVPSTQEFSPHIHIFFELGDGSYLAFFELANAMAPQRDPNTPDWVQHLALEVVDEAALHEGKRRLTERGIDVVGPADHRFCKSIYFFDPSGHRMEMTARTEKTGDLDQFARAAPATLADWEARKRQGALNGPAMIA
jgi:glyoxylase I family protein